VKEQDIVAECVEEVRSGRSTIESCVARYPKMGERLRTLLEIVVRLGPDEVTPSPEFRRRAGESIYGDSRRVSSASSARLRLWPRSAWAGVAVSVLAGLIIVGGTAGTAYAAQSSLPGDVLYPVKTGIENLQMAATFGPAAKARLHVKLAQRRIDEVVQQAELDRNLEPQALDTIGKQLDSAIKELANSGDTEATLDTLSRMSATTLHQQLELTQSLVKSPQSRQALEQAIDDIRRANIIARVAYANQDFLKQQPSVTDKRLDIDQFKVDGTLLSIEGTRWNVGGTILENVRLPGKAPATGSHVKIEGLARNGEVFLTRLEVSEESATSIRVEGWFEGTNENGTSNIGGISVDIVESDTTQLRPGDNVQLKAESEGKLSVTAKQSRRSEREDNVTLSGVLTAIDTHNKTMTVKMAGNQVTVNVGEARIMGRNNTERALELSATSRLVGCDIKFEGLHKKDGLIFARHVRISVDD
jgi:hypothetical protein